MVNFQLFDCQFLQSVSLGCLGTQQRLQQVNDWLGLVRVIIIFGFSSLGCEFFNFFACQFLQSVSLGSLGTQQRLLQINNWLGFVGVILIFLSSVLQVVTFSTFLTANSSKVCHQDAQEPSKDSSKSKIGFDQRWSILISFVSLLWVVIFFLPSVIFS